MHVLVLLAGIADPKWPLPARLDEAALLEHRGAHEVLSPFDEAALEVALKLRDADPQVRITAVALCGEALARRIASFRLDRTLCIAAGDLPAWSARDAAARLLPHVRECDPPIDLLLTGREFGDYDDGTLAPHLAAMLGMPCLSLVLAVQREGEAIRALCSAPSGLERVAAPLPLLATVTNDSGNRLRQPLLKNVMAARKLPFDLQRLDPAAAVQVALTAVEPARAVERAQACRFLGGSVEEQAAALAQLLAGEGSAR